ncbi:MAG: NAD+ synthase [Actinomycetia bacterium]|nr:NAD+ synthase [Actinomycetes bacterium]MCP4087265.1 NAD+ synthase [Actinomycetes bacterium]
MERLRVAACQLDVVVGDLDGNVDKILAALAQAEEAGADVAVFSELAVCGYPPEDLLLKPSFVRANRDALQRVAASTNSCAAVVGFVDEDRDLYNAAALCAHGRVMGTYRKRLLPNYGVFDEKRYFAVGTEPLQLFEVAGVKVAMTICEDAWSANGPVYEHSAGGADVILNINASPYHAGKWSERESMLSARSADSSCSIVYVNQVGGQDELVFDGASMVFDESGTLVTRLPQFHEAIETFDLDVRAVHRKRNLDPRGRPSTPPLPVVPVTDSRPVEGPPTIPAPAPRLGRLAEIWEALVTGTRDYTRKNRFTDVVIALSGGIDSTVVTAIAADALGPERVHCVLMPSRYSSDHSVSDAVALCENLGVEHRTIPIEPAHSAFEEMLEPSFDGLDPGLTEENLQSRIRGVTVMGLSNKFGWLVLTTGNKSESAVGYSTLYGDTAGGYAVIKDVFKIEIYELCRDRNRRAGREIIPNSVIDKKPSAELRPDQFDDQSLPPYPVLDAILELYVEQDHTATEIIALGHDEAIVRKVVRLVDIAEYKRRQTPLGIRVTTKAFGRDRRLPIVNRFRD